MNNPKLDLYYYDACPFCAMVLNKIKSLNVKVNYKHIHNEPSNLDKLVQDTGRRTTPCLYIDEKPMFESSDIMSWLENNLDNLDKIS